MNYNPVSIGTLDDSSITVVYAARTSLCTIGSIEATEPLIKHLFKTLHKSGWREQDITCLTKLATSNSNTHDYILHTLIKALDDKAGYVQLLAMEMLGTIGDERGIEPLRKMLEVPKSFRSKYPRWNDLHKAAIASLKQIGTPNAIKAIQTGAEVHSKPVGNCMNKHEKATELISEILEETTGGMEFDENFDLSELEMGWEDFIACTGSAFNLPDDWTGNGDEIDSTLKVFVEFVCSQWDGTTINNEWRSASELLGGL